MSGSTGNVIGSGSDSITLKMAEDQAQGTDAVFTVNVDGQQVGPAQTVTASQSAGQTEDFTFKGDWAPGSHGVTVTFGNNFLYPGTSGDRNLYVDGVTYSGQTVSSSTTPIYESPLFPPNSTTGDVYGNATFSVNDTSPVPSGASPEQSPTPSAVTVGSGPDTLKLDMAEDPYQGDAQFTVSVDGKQIGGTQTTTAHLFEGQSQEFDVKGDFGSGTHNVDVTFLNDQIGDFYPAGTPGLPSGQWAVDTTDRNLYVMDASLNGGTAASGLPWELSSNGTKSFSVTAGSGSSSSGSGSSSSGSGSSSSDSGSSPPSSGASASDEASASGNNAAVTSDNVSAGSSGDSMSFITISTSNADSAASGSDGTTSGGSGTTKSTDTSGSGSGTTATDQIPTLSSTLTDTSATPPAPATGTTDTDSTATAASSDQTATTGRTAGQWWTNHHHGDAVWSHHSG